MMLIILHNYLSDGRGLLLNGVICDAGVEFAFIVSRTSVEPSIDDPLARTILNNKHISSGLISCWGQRGSNRQSEVGG